jgi:8-oxo-dGTP diphosphatase
MYCVSILIDINLIKMSRQITKVGLAVMKDDCLLLVRKKGSTFYILPGGKPESGETDVQTLSREIDEELGCTVDAGRLTFLGAFSDAAAGMPGVEITIRLYAGDLVGTPSPHAEIDTVLWWTLRKQEDATLAPSLRNSILPFLCYSSAGSTSERQKSSSLR